MNKQHGYIDLDLGFIFVLTIVGLVAGIIGAVWVVTWLMEHIRFV